MSLKCGIIGLTNIGKTTLFNCMSKTRAQSSNFAFSTNKSNMGMCDVPDPRLWELDKLIKAEKVVPALVELVDIPGLAKGASQGEGIGNSFLADIRQTDALIHVLRCFDDENLAHIEGSVNPVRDKEIVELELQIKDLDQVEKKILRAEKAAKTGDKDAKKMLEVLHAYKAHFENFANARTIDLDAEDKKYVADLMLLTDKPVVYVCNVDGDSAISGNAYSEKLKEAVKNEKAEVLVIAGQMEAEIAELESMEDREVFLQDMGLSEPGVNKLIRSSYRLLDLISFFTIGGKENRAWTIPMGVNAQVAAGTIHSDLERGFIRAEVIKYNDFIQYKTEVACRNAGKISLEGKQYIVEDGDILHIRFNV